MTNPYETLKNLNETLNKIIANPNIPANQKEKIILNLTRAIENITKSLPAYIPEAKKTKKDEEIKKELESERKAAKSRANLNKFQEKQETLKNKEVKST
jgi:hypothetical protein